MTRGSGSLRRAAARLLTALAMLLAAAHAARAQEHPRPQTPWAVGEYLEYSLKVGPMSAGSGRMEVVGRDTVRARPVWHFRFTFSGGLPLLRVDDSFDSWVDADTHNSLRFEQRLNEIGKRRHRLYEIFPERGIYQRFNPPKREPEEERESVANPLDDASFFFFIRTIPLEVGKSYDLNRYFDNRANPVTIRVLRRDTVEVPAGTFPAIVIQPMIKTGGIFAEGGHAELWLSDDERRILLQMKSKVPIIGSLNLYLRKLTLPPLSGGNASHAGRP